MARLAATLSFLIFGLLLTLSSAPGAQEAGGVTYSLRGYNLETFSAVEVLTALTAPRPANYPESTIAIAPRRQCSGRARG